MGSLAQCLRNCLEHDENRQDSSYEPPRPGRMARSFQYSETSTNDDVDEVEQNDDDGDCCRPDPLSRTQGDEHSGLRGFWNQLRHHWKYDSLEHVSSSQPESLSRPSLVPSGMDPPLPPTGRSFGVFRRANSLGKTHAVDIPSRKKVASSPLRAADSFDESPGIPSISPDEIVLPGSKLQKLMASHMAQSIEEMGEECVICMEGFDATNPRMPTLCGCGENKTYFHLPCLYQWIEQDRNCPSCRQRLRWEEF